MGADQDCRFRSFRRGAIIGRTVTIGKIGIMLTRSDPMSKAAGDPIRHRLNEENECGQSAKKIRADATAVAVSAWPS